MKEWLIALLKALGVDVEAKKAEIEKAAEEYAKAHAPKQDPPKTEQATALAAATGGDPALKAELDAVKQQMKDVLAALTAEKDAREKAQKTIQEQMKADQVKKVEDLLNAQEKEGRVTKAMRDHFKKILEQDFETGKKIIEALPVDPAAKKAAQATQTKDGKPADGTKDLPAGPALRGLEGMAPRAILKGIQEMSESNN